MPTELVSSKEVLNFLKCFMAGQQGFVQVEAIPPVMVEGETAKPERKTVSVANINKLGPWIEDHRDLNLYFRPNLIGEPQGSGKGGAACKADIIAGNYFHVDLDPAEPPAGASLDEKREHLAAERLRLRQQIDAFTVPPTFIIDSGGGYQLFWQSAEPVSVADTEAVNMRLCAYFETPDACWSAQHLMRLPYTTNWPGLKKLEKGRTVVPTLLLEQNGNAYSPADFDFLPPVAPKAKATNSIGHAGTDALPERFVELLAGDEALRKRWEGNTEGLDDPSRNGLDMSLTALLVARGFNDAEITAIHRAYPHGKVVQDGRGADYIRPMIDKCRANRTLSRTEPLINARRMLAELFTTDDGVSLLRYWHSDFYLWRDGAYRMLDEQDMSARVWAYLGGARHFVSKGKSEPFKPNRTRAGDTLGAMKAIAHLDSHIPNPCWLDGTAGDDPKELLVVANGILHTPSRTLRPHDPRLFTTTALPFAYAPNADPPVEWLAFLKSLLGDDKEAIETLQEFFGYSLTTDCSQQKILLVVGPRRSGKGTITRVLRGVIGEANCAWPTLASLATNFGLQPLIGKRLAGISDARLGNHTDKHALTERLCSISGEDVLTIDRKYIDPWTGRLGVRLVIFTNELPKIIDDSNALSSRFIVLRLTNSFFGKEDLGLADRLLKELTAILNWSLDGLAQLKARGAFRQPVSALGLVQELEDLTSPIGAFLRDKCVVRPGAYVECHQLYGAWANYCACEGWHSAGTSASFGASLRAALPQLERKYLGPKANRHWVYSGVALATGTATVADLAAVGAKHRALLL